MLLDAGADMNVKDKYGITPLSGASSNGHVNCMELLMRKAADKGKPQYIANLVHPIITINNFVLVQS